MASSAVHNLCLPSSSTADRRLSLGSGRGLGAAGRQGSRFKTLRVAALRQDGGGDRDDGFSGDEPPESLFMKELKRRGLAPPTKYSGASTETKTKREEFGSGEDSGDTAQSFKSSTSSSSSPSNSSEWRDDRSGQLKRTLALNSEGLDGLIPRAQELIKLGATFFLAFWPLIIAIVALFVAIYLYFGPSFIHEGDLHGGKPPYVDPFQLLEEESLSKEPGLSPYVR
ncbi:uncharacterized protein LOC9662636 [Selaginella moellendorffii]|uniref:uncharacterized protein LOC9662636 n=1 Tax=Selaginella moellendorffii TaxID=88036 RepID=UPI000D1C8561|nr:uncharacterized protein LOC9662636 [Selaginella moellendorffii]|eukprot:XP_024520253.1 uncharacterized protein LOC9662636 [Selaginella moellendorffii]